MVSGTMGRISSYVTMDFIYLYTHICIYHDSAIPEMLHNDTAALENRSHLINAEGTHQAFHCMAWLLMG